MDRKTFSIGILSLTAVILFVATLFPVTPAKADFSVKDIRGMQLITVANQQGGDVLYVIEPRSSKVIVFAYNATTKTLRPVATGDLQAAFAGR